MIKISSNSELTVLQAEWDACMHACMNTQHSYTNRNMATCAAICIIYKTESLFTQPKQVISMEFVKGNTKLSDMSTG